MAGTKRRSEKQILEILKELKASGESVREFAKKNNLAVSTLDYWRRKYRGRRPAPPRLRRVSVVPSVAPGPVFYEVQARSGETLRIRSTAEEGSARSMLTMFLATCSH